MVFSFASSCRRWNLSGVAPLDLFMVPEALEFDICELFLKNRLLLPLLLSTSLSPTSEPWLVFDALEALDYLEALESVLL